VLPAGTLLAPGYAAPWRSVSDRADQARQANVVENVGIDPDRPTWEGSAALDASGIAVLVVAPVLDLAERWLTRAVADLARRQDLVVVCGPGGLDNAAAGTGQLGSYTLTGRLRDLLPRRSVIAVLVSDHPDAERQEFAAIAGLIETSAVAVAVVLGPDPVPVAALLARHLQTGTLLLLDRDGYRRIVRDPSPA